MDRVRILQKEPTTLNKTVKFACRLDAISKSSTPSTLGITSITSTDDESSVVGSTEQLQNGADQRCDVDSEQVTRRAGPLSSGERQT